MFWISSILLSCEILKLNTCVIMSIQRVSSVLGCSGWRCIDVESSSADERTLHPNLWCEANELRSYFSANHFIISFSLYKKQDFRVSRSCWVSEFEGSLVNIHTLPASTAPSLAIVGNTQLKKKKKGPGGREEKQRKRRGWLEVFLTQPDGS